jgi:WD40 repeat protein
VKSRRETRRGDTITTGKKGYLSFLATHGSRVKVWDWNEAVEQESMQDHSREDEGEALYAIAAEPRLDSAIAGYGSSKVWVWQSSDRALRWSSEVSTGGSNRFSITELDGRAILVTGEYKLLQAYDMTDGRSVFEPIQIDGSIYALATHIVDGEPLCFLAVAMEGTSLAPHYVVRVWNLRSGVEYNTKVHSEWAFKLGRGWEDVPLICFYYELSDGTPLVLAAGRPNFVQMWDLRTLHAIAELKIPGKYDSYQVLSLVCVRFASRDIAVAGRENGVICIWDLESRSLLKEIPQAHRSRVQAIAKPEFGDILLSGGDDGILKVWSASFDELLQIEIGASVNGIAPLTGNEVAIASDQGLLVLKLSEQLSSHSLREYLPYPELHREA